MATLEHTPDPGSIESAEVRVLAYVEKHPGMPVNEMLEEIEADFAAGAAKAAYFNLRNEGKIVRALNHGIYIQQK
jgi:hypothetical protein